MLCIMSCFLFCVVPGNIAAVANEEPNKILNTKMNTGGKWRACFALGRALWPARTTGYVGETHRTCFQYGLLNCARVDKP